MDEDRLSGIEGENLMEKPRNWILVTGAGGFVGQHCLRRLLEAGHKVVALQRSPKSLPRLPIHDTDSFKRLEGDLTDQITCPYPIDAIVHLAAQVVFPGITAAQFSRGNILSTIGMFELAQTLAVSRLIMHSSISVYGQPQSCRWSESTPSTAPFPYGASKYVCERVAADYAGKMRIVVPRTPGIIGQGANPNWITTLVDRAIGNQTIRIHNADAAFNSTLHVDDYCDFVLAELASEETNPVVEIVNLAAKDPIPVADVATTIVRQASSQSQIVDNGPAGSPAIVDIGKAKSNFGFNPMSVEETLKRYVQEVTRRS